MHDRDTGVRLDLDLLATPVALCQLPPAAPLPAWLGDAMQFLSVTRTPTELSIAADDVAVPIDVVATRGFRVLRVRGPLAFDLVGIMASLASPLAAARVPIFSIATVDTDYLLVDERDLARALAALHSAGHTIHAAS